MQRLEGGVAERADENLVVHVTWVTERTAGMTSSVTEGLVIADSGLPCDSFNFVCRARLGVGAAPDISAAAVAYFGERRRPFSWWVGPADQPPGLGAVLEGLGLARAETELAMALPLAAVQHLHAPEFSWARHRLADDLEAAPRGAGPRL